MVTITYFTKHSYEALMTYKIFIEYMKHMSFNYEMNFLVGLKKCSNYLELRLH